MDDEISSFFDGEIRAAQGRNRRVSSRGGTLPHLACLHRFTRRELLVLYALGKEMASRPFPYFASERVDNDKVVRLAVREIEFHVLRALIHDVERELHVALPDLDREAGLDFRRAMRRGGSTSDFFRGRRGAGIDRNGAGERGRRFGV